MASAGTSSTQRTSQTTPSRSPKSSTKSASCSGLPCDGMFPPQGRGAQPDVAASELRGRLGGFGRSHPGRSRALPRFRQWRDLITPAGSGQTVTVGEHLRDRCQQRVEPSVARTRWWCFDRIVDPVRLVLEPINEVSYLDPVRFGVLPERSGGQPSHAKGPADRGVVDAQPLTRRREQPADHRDRRVQRSGLDTGRGRRRNSSPASERADGETRVFPGSSERGGCIHRRSVYATPSAATAGAADSLLTARNPPDNGRGRPLGRPERPRRRGATRHPAAMSA